MPNIPTFNAPIADIRVPDTGAEAWGRAARTVGELGRQSAEATERGFQAAARGLDEAGAAVTKHQEYSQQLSGVESLTKMKADDQKQLDAILGGDPDQMENRLVQFQNEREARLTAFPNQFSNDKVKLWATDQASSYSLESHRQLTVDLANAHATSAMNSGLRTASNISDGLGQNPTMENVDRAISDYNTSIQSQLNSPYLTDITKRAELQKGLETYRSQIVQNALARNPSLAPQIIQKYGNLLTPEQQYNLQGKINSDAGKAAADAVIQGTVNNAAGAHVPLGSTNGIENGTRAAAVLKNEFHYSDAAITGVLNNMGTESNGREWNNPGGAGEMGMYQFNPQSHLPIFEKQMGGDHSVEAQTRYVAQWVNKNMPGYGQSTDSDQATAQFMHGFEAPKDQSNSALAYRIGYTNWSKSAVEGLTNQAPPQNPAHPTSAQSTAPAAGSIAFGDSIGWGLVKHAGMGGVASSTGPSSHQQFAAGDTTAIGTNPGEILTAINGMPDNSLGGKTVVLSTGASNAKGDTSQVQDQIDALKKKGAGNIVVLGVGPRKDVVAANDQLSQIAQKNADKGVTFSGPLTNTSDGIHPAKWAEFAQGLPIKNSTTSPAAGGSYNLDKSRWVDPQKQFDTVKPNVMSWMNTAADAALPKGWKIEIHAGAGNHTPNTYQGGVSQVPAGQAVDIQLIDPSGKHIDNSLHQDPNSETYKIYQNLGDAYIKASGGQGRWGGYYSDPDVMQFGTVVPGSYPRGNRAPDSLYAGAAQQGSGSSSAPGPAADISGGGGGGGDQAAAAPGQPTNLLPSDWRQPPAAGAGGTTAPSASGSTRPAFPSLEGWIKSLPTNLTPDQRDIAIEHLQRRHEQMVQQTAEERAALTENIQGGLAKLRNGQPYQYNEGDIRAVLEPKIADRVVGQLQQAEQIGQQIGAIRQTPADELNTNMTMLQNSLKDTDPADFRERKEMVESYVTAAKENLQKLGIAPSDRPADPAAYIQATNTDIGRAFKAQDRNNPASMQSYATKQLAWQEHLGVPSERQHVMSIPEAQEATRQIVADPTNAQATMNKLQQQYGPAFDHIWYDMTTLGGLPAQYQLMGAMSHYDAGLLAQGMTEQTTAKITAGGTDKGTESYWTDTLGEKNVNAIKASIRDPGASPLVTQFMNSMRNSNASGEQIRSLLGAVDTLAFSRSQYLHEDPETAATKAVQSAFGHYTFYGDARIPNQYADAVKPNADNLMENLKVENMAVPPGVGGKGQPTMDQYLTYVKAHPTWYTTQKEDGIELVDPAGRVVNDKAGNPMRVDFKSPAPTVSVPIPGEGEIPGATPPGGMP